MPKYTTQRLERFLKIDSKTIKKSNPELKNSQILNTLSTFLGYKNYQEVKNRENDSTLIILDILKKDELNNLKEAYLNKINNHYGLSLSKHSFSDLESLFHSCWINHPISKKDTIIDLSDNKTVIELNNFDYIHFVKKMIHIYWKDEHNIFEDTLKLFTKITKLMSYNRINSIQKEIHKYLDIKFINDEISKIPIRKIRHELYFFGTKNEEMALNFLMYIMEIPYFDLTSDYKNIIYLNSIKNEKKNYKIICHNKNYNKEIINYLFSHFYMGIFKKKTLPSNYLESLNGFKMQAEAATKMLSSNNEQDRDILTKAQGLMYQNQEETFKINNLLKQNYLSIDDLNEEVLFDLIHESDFFILNHLKKEPLYILMNKVIDNKDYYFISTYNEDKVLYGGHSPSLEETIYMLERNIKDNDYEEVVYIDKSSEEYKNVLCKHLKHPELISNIYRKV